MENKVLKRLKEVLDDESECFSNFINEKYGKNNIICLI